MQDKGWENASFDVNKILHEIEYKAERLAECIES